MNKSTSWQSSSTWYKYITKDKGHYYHEHVVLPGVLELLKVQNNDAVLDFACGTGVLGRRLPNSVSYVGVDIAPALVEEAKKQDKHATHAYIVGNITSEGIGGLKGQEALGKTKRFTHVTCILALQNVENFQSVFNNAARFLHSNGTFIIVLNHPTFRIPRQTSWGIDEQSKLQYRRVNRYLSPIKIPVTTHPGKGNHSPVTWSFHQPLYVYVNGLHSAGFVISHMEEWASDKESEGKFGKMENRARAEIPLFMTIVAKKETATIPL